MMNSYDNLVSGQALLITVVAIGGMMLGATVIAGLLMIFQLRQAGDLADSNKAIFAADAGIEMAGYLSRFSGQTIDTNRQVLVDENNNYNGAAIDKIVCYNSIDTADPASIIDPCAVASPPPLVIRSYGQSGRANRSLQQ